TRASAITAAALVVLVLAAAGPSQVRGDVPTGAGTADYIAAARIATPCNARILPTVTSKGAFQALTGRADILEGMAPFLRPAILRTTVRLTHLARRYLAHPAAHPGFLDAEHVDDLLVGRGKAAGWAALHDRRVSVAGGAAVFAVPRGLVGTAAAQPMPVHLLDHDCGDCEQLATFSITHGALRPGLLLRSAGPYEYVGVTAEEG